MSARPFLLFVSSARYPVKNRKYPKQTCPRVLYIEDHDDTRELVTLVLGQHGVEVVTGSTIATGVALAGAEEFDLYLLDSWLPDGSGLELCRQLRRLDQTTPILFYSAAAYEMDRQQALNSGAQAYLVKPSHPSELSALVTSLIDEHRKLSRAVV
jgi:DNA-binding response OmpR family regulator